MLTLIAVAASVSPLMLADSTFDVASRCRELSQQACREYLLVASHLDETQNRSRLTTSITTLDFAVQSLRVSLPTLPEAQRGRSAVQIDSIVSAWDGLRPTFSAASSGGCPTPPDLSVVATSTTYLFFKLDALCTSLESTQTPQSILARQTVLADRMTCEALFVSLNVTPETFRRRLDRSLESFSQFFTTFLSEDQGAQRAFASVFAHFDSVKTSLTDATFGQSTTDLKTVVTALAAFRTGMTEWTVAVKNGDSSTRFTTVTDTH